MKHYVFLTDDGIYVRQSGKSFVVPDGAVEVDSVNNVEDYFTLMFVDGGWLERPLITAPLVVGNIVTFTDLPAGVVITITDLETNAVLAETDEPIFQLEDAGRYLVEVTAPLPWMGWNGVIQC